MRHIKTFKTIGEAVKFLEQCDPVSPFSQPCEIWDESSKGEVKYTIKTKDIMTLTKEEEALLKEAIEEHEEEQLRMIRTYVPESKQKEFCRTFGVDERLDNN